MKILYIGDDQPHTTSAHRAGALMRLGHEVVHVNPRAPLPAGRIVAGISTRLGYGVFSPLINAYIRNRVKGHRFDIVWIDCGAEISPNLYRWLQKQGAKVINYNVDDPFGQRDGRKWDLYRASVPWHDLTVVVREENVAEAKAAGARQVKRVFRSYDPVAHAPVEPTAEEFDFWSSEVCFVGCWMPERGPFLKRLIELDVPLIIRGNRWEKAAEWARLKPFWKGPGLCGKEYVLSLQCAKVTLGLLSKGNRDLHTTRSSEVPFMGGGAFCAERTLEHESMYREGIEAEFWSNPEECAEKCVVLLKDEAYRRSLVDAAKLRLKSLGLSNDEVLQQILTELGL